MYLIIEHQLLRESLGALRGLLKRNPGISLEYGTYIQYFCAIL